jgi:hypothetical protein
LSPTAGFSYDGAMNKQIDRNVWKAAKKAGLIAHKIRNITTLPEGEDVFMVYAQRKDTGNLNWQGLFTAKGLVEAIAEGLPLELDVPCTSRGD